MDVYTDLCRGARHCRRLSGNKERRGWRAHGLALLLACLAGVWGIAQAAQDVPARGSSVSAVGNPVDNPFTLTPEEDTWRRQHPVIQVGVLAGDHLPAETWVAGRPDGFGVDYARLLAGKAGLRLSFHPYGEPVMVVGAGMPYDLLAAMTPGQAARAGFELLTPYAAGHLVAVARKGDERIHGERDLASMRIAIERDASDIADVLSRRYPHAVLVAADDDRQALSLLSSGRADVYIGTTLSRMRLQSPEHRNDELVVLESLELPPLMVGLAVPRDRGILLGILRKAEAGLSVDEVTRLRTRWGVRADTESVASTQVPTIAERDWLQGLPPLRLGFEIDRYPYTFLDSQGQLSGMAADYMEIVQETLGLRIQPVPAKDWNQLRRMVHDGEVDLMAATTPDDFSSRDMVFSRAYEHFPQVIVAPMHSPVLSGPEDLARRTVAVREEMGLLFRLKALSPTTRWLSVGSADEGMAMVASGQADAYVGALPVVDALIRDRYAATLRVTGPADLDQDLSIGVVNRYEQLMPLVNRVLAGVSDRQRQAIRSHWLTAQYHYGVPWRWVRTGLLAALLVLGGMAISYFRQRRAMRAQHAAEQSLAAQLRFQQALLETIPYPVFVKDDAGCYIAVNRAYEAMFHASRDDLLGHTLAETRHVAGLDADALHASDMQQLARSSGSHHELHVSPPDASGGTRDSLLWLHVFNRGGGQGTCLLGTLVDVSELRKAEARALASEQKLIDTNESLPGVVLRACYMPDGSSRFDYVGGDSEALFGLTHGELTQGRRRLSDVILEDDRPAMRQAVQRAKEGFGPQGVEYRIALPSGLRWGHASFGLPRREDDGTVFCSIYCDDITAEKAQAQALVEATTTAEAAVAAKGAFLAMMSHEIRTPMAGVLGLIELLGKTALDREQSHMLDMVRDSASALLQILDDILDFSRIEAGRLTLSEHPFDLRAMTDGVLGLFATLAREKGLALYATLDWRLAAQYRGDMTRIRQIVTNLLSNALKFTSKGHVELHMELLEDAPDGQRMAISVHDTGIGIAQEQLDRLFQPFVQADASTSRRYGGTGLGLTICQRLAHMMEGEIRITSSLGFGTSVTFDVRLPVAQALRPQPALAGKRALLCTGDILLERELSNTLSALGLSIIGADARDLPESDAHNVDIYVVDAALARGGALPPGVRVIRLLDAPDPRGFFVEEGHVALSGYPLLWRSAMEACHTVLGISLPARPMVPGVSPVRHAARILVAEDHPINRAVLGRQLDCLGYAHTIVDNGQEALRALANGHYDLLITDCHMPLLDGYTLARRIREGEAGSDTHLPIIALSASALPEEVVRCHEAGMDEFLAKPVQLSTLDAMLSASLEGRLPKVGRETPEADPAVDGRLRTLKEVFGSARQVRDLLRGLLDTTRQDLRELEHARLGNDAERQRDILHRIRGALRLVDNQLPAGSGSVVQQRDELLRHLRALEVLLARLESGMADA